MEYEFIRNDKDKSFSFAGKTINSYGMLYSANSALKLMGYPTSHTKANYKAFGDKYGVSAVKFVKIHNAIITSQWIDPVREWSKRLAFVGVTSKPNKALLEMVHKNLPILEQAKKDGIENVTPLLFAFNKNPSEVKALLGKSLWKTLCKNSFTRNNHIRKIISKYSFCVYIPSQVEITRCKKLIMDLNLFPSSLLKRGGKLSCIF